MSGFASIRVDLADEPTVEIPGFTGPSLRVARYVRVGETLEHLGISVRLEAESLEALRDWLTDAAAQVDAVLVERRQRGEPDTDAVAADAGALA